MCNPNRRKELTLSVLWLLSLLMAPVLSFGEETDQQSANPSAPNNDYLLTIEDNLISVRAEKALLSPIIEEIRRRMGIEVIADIPPEETVTVSFERLPLADALKKLSANYIFITASETEPEKVTKITLLPKSRETVRETAEGSEDSPNTPGSLESFKFEFDPAAATQEEQ